MDPPGYGCARPDWSSQKYWPFGATRSGAISQTDKLYTGQQQEPGDSAPGLYNYKARFYSTAVGRFVSADPSNAGGLNRYAYALSNPLKFTDPTGLCVLGQECTEDEFLNFVRCASGSSECDYPDPPLETWPAGSAPSGEEWADSWQRFARWAVGETEFWGHFKGLWEQSAAQSLHEAVLFGIVAGGTDFADLNVFPALAWSEIGSKFGVSSRFMFLSVFDLAHGTNFILLLASKDYLRAIPWWRGLSAGSASNFAKALGGDTFKRNLSSVFQASG